MLSNMHSSQGMIGGAGYTHAHAVRGNNLVHYCAKAAVKKTQKTVHNHYKNNAQAIHVQIFQVL